MRYVPPFVVLKKWMARYAVVGNARLTPSYDDVLDVLKKFLGAIPVDEAWYRSEYPGVAAFLARVTTETAADHFQRHGYFEGRKPFSPGWRGLTLPVPFRQCHASLHVAPERGRLRVDVSCDDFLVMLTNILIAVPVDEPWYRTVYPGAADDIDNGRYLSASDHFVQRGYFDGYLPCETIVDEKWYVNRYEHVRTALHRRVAVSAQDHFLRVGYIEGCRPVAP